jgi:hypothetical protein
MPHRGRPSEASSGWHPVAVQKGDRSLMGISQIPDQIKRAPAGALRAVFSGIGRILLAADRPGPPPPHAQPDFGTARTLPPKQAARQQRPVPSQPAAESRWRSLDQTGNVRVLTADEIYSDSLPELSDGGASAPAGTKIATATKVPAATKDLVETIDPAARKDPAATKDPAASGGLIASDAAPATASLELPLAGYDTLSLASIRARLRTLSTDQLKVLADYERMNAERADVLGMLERRIEKVENGR